MLAQLRSRAFRSGALAVALPLAVVLATPSAGSAAWREPEGGANGVSSIGSEPSMASIDGVAYVAWTEKHGNSEQVFVAHLNDAGDRWEKVGGPVNADLAHSAAGPSLGSVGGVPYVAFAEFSGFSAGTQVRVARLNAAGNGWEEPWRSVDATHGGINHDPLRDAIAPRIASVDGVPYVAWEELDGSTAAMRVAKLDTSTQPLPTWTESWAGVTATSGGIERVAGSETFLADLAPVSNTPYVAWREKDGSKYQVRVARLNVGANAWEEPWNGVSDTSGGINDPTHNTGFRPESRPSLASINGYPYVAWTDGDARVARLDTSTFPAPTWKQEAAGVTATDGRINETPTNSASGVSLASVDAGAFGVAVPYVAWAEQAGAAADSLQVRVARFDKTGRAWLQVWPHVSPTYGGINETLTTKQHGPDLVSAGGVPYVASQFSPGPGIQVSRLEPEFTSQSASPSATGATLTASAHTYGIPYPIGFRYGTALGSETTPVPAASGKDDVTVSSQVTGLATGTSYQYQPFATAGAPAPRVLGQTMSFTTASASSPAAVSGEKISPKAFPAAPSGPSARAAKRRFGATVSYSLNEPATVLFTVTQRRTGRTVKRGATTVCVTPTKKNRAHKRCTHLVTLAGSFSRNAVTGANSFHFSGRLGGRKLKPGRYSLVATPTAGPAPGQPASAGFRIVK